MKKRKTIVLVILSLIVISACNKKNKKNDDDQDIVTSENKEVIKSYYDLPHIREFYGWEDFEFIEPPELVVPDDLSKLDYDELRILRNEIYARNGYLFDDGFLRGYFNKNKWYMPIFDVDTFKIYLNKKEVDLVEKIKAEEEKRKEVEFVDVNGFRLFNPALIVNKKQFDNIPGNILQDLEKNNFSIVDANRPMPFYVYDENAYQFVPHYITTDLYLYILHKYFSTFIENLDENYMYGQLLSILSSIDIELKKLENNTTNQETKDAIEWAKTYNAIALFALTGKDIPEFSKKSRVFNLEKTLITRKDGFPAFIENRTVNYNELKPRGHYTKNDTLKKYFSCFKWMSLNGINLDKDDELKGFITFTYIIKNNKKLYKSFVEYIETFQKLAGKEDNLSISDLIDIIPNQPIEEALSKKNLKEIRRKLKELNKEKIKKVFGESYFPEERFITRVYFFSSTYSISGDIFSKLIHIDAANSKRPFPRGLDIPAVFGNQTAKDIIFNDYKDADKWQEYTNRFDSLQDHFKTFDNWNENYGYKGVQTALSASEEQENYPAFMKTDAYNRKELSTTLASWTHIKHDLILYQEKPWAAEAGQGGGPPPPKHYSYVESNIIFWNQALELVEWLEDISELAPKYADELERIKEIGLQLQSCAQKELDGINLTDEEHHVLHFIGGKIEYILLGLLETDHLPEREKSMALIADVYIYNDTNLNVAVGHADDIYVVVPLNGEYYISRGAVFSYFEFKDDKIYNDEEWKKKVKLNTVPDRPKWLKKLIKPGPTPKSTLEFRFPGYGMPY
jgi:hypothetical protein